MPRLLRVWSGITHHRKLFAPVVGAAVAVATWTLLETAGLSAEVRIPFPSAQDPGGPVYTTLERGLVFHSGSVAAILFYRDPACVPEDFNLLDGQDLVGFPENPRAFACPSTVDGFAIWNRGPLLDLAPRQVFTRGTGAVPVWFVSWTELEGAMSDDTLFIAELRGLSSLQVGYAIHFEEHRILSEILDPSELVTTLALDGVSTGALSSAHTLRKFEFSYNFRRGRVRDVRIRFE
jgi:hypothetical protein